ncbi:MAG: RluA family pseudouridine synthase [Bacteroidia bacterium]|jgi:23S rRNA pseudouridine1911/1915/1917 synthase|nr:RluA family pseudouridine synthase [Bacteroidia bacterium]
MKKTKAPGETTLRVNEPAELMQFLLAKMGGMSRNSVKSLLSHRQVMVNGKVTTLFNTALKAGDTVLISSARGNIELTHPKLKVIFEDQYLIVVEKKEGLLTVTTGKSDETTAFSILKNYVKKASPQNRIYVVHRLDRETSGVIMFAKTREIQLALQENWHRVITRRVYVALVEGKVEKPEDTIVTWLTENEKSLKIHSSKVDNGGQQAVTHYRTIKTNDKFSLLEVELETGRKNQIRVHMQDIGHPIVGDKKYGSEVSPIGRVGLHARVLAFIHPMSLENVTFETHVPKTFTSVFR